MNIREQAPGAIVAGLPIPEFRRIGVTPLTGACGCDITGVDLSRPLSDEVIGEIRQHCSTIRSSSFTTSI